MGITRALLGTVAYFFARWSGYKATITIDTATIANSTAIDFRSYAGGAVYVAATIASVTLTWYGAPTRDDTFVPLYDSSGVALTTTLPGGAAAGAEIPAACFAWPFLKCLSNADDGETITVVLKT